MVFRNRNNQLELWNGNLFADLFEDSFVRRNVALMKTDIKEDDDKYIFDIDLPGYNKEDIKISMENGYLTIEGKHEDNQEQKDEKGTYLRRERRCGEIARSYYVGEVNEDKIEASFKNGVLTINVFKQKEPLPEAKKYISIQ